MKKIYYIILGVLVVFGGFYINCSFALPSAELVLEQSNNYSVNSISKEYLVYIDEVSHTVKFEGKNESRGSKVYLIIDGAIVRSIDVNQKLEFDKSLGYLDFGKEDFSFIKGKDDRTYLGIRLGATFTIINSKGKILKHKPNFYEFDCFYYLANYPYKDKILSSDKRINLIDNKGNSIVEQEFFDNEKFQEWGGKVSLKVESDKFYGFVLVPDAPHYNYFDEESPTMLFLNEYVIDNDEIYYKKIKTFNVHASE